MQFPLGRAASLHRCWWNCTGLLRAELQFSDSWMWPPANLHKDPTIPTACLWPKNAKLKRVYLKNFQRAVAGEFGDSGISICRCFHTLSGVVSNLLSGMWTDGLALCQRFSCSVFFLLHNCQTALEFTVGAFRCSAAVPVTPTTTLYPWQVTGQDKKQLCCQSTKHLPPGKKMVAPGDYVNRFSKVTRKIIIST